KKFVSVPEIRYRHWPPGCGRPKPGGPPSKCSISSALLRRSSLFGADSSGQPIHPLRDDLQRTLKPLESAVEHNPMIGFCRKARFDRRPGPHGPVAVADEEAVARNAERLPESEAQGGDPLLRAFDDLHREGQVAGGRTRGEGAREKLRP